MTLLMNSDEFLKEQLLQASSYLGLKLRLNTWSPGDGWTRFMIVDNEEGEDYELSRYLTRGEVAEVLLSINRIFNHLHVLEQRKIERLQELRKEGGGRGEERG
jgi:hypothetical protein